MWTMLEQQTAPQDYFWAEWSHLLFTLIKLTSKKALFDWRCKSHHSYPFWDAFGPKAAQSTQNTGRFLAFSEVEGRIFEKGPTFVGFKGCKSELWRNVDNVFVRLLLIPSPLDSRTACGIWEGTDVRWYFRINMWNPPVSWPESWYF